MSTEHYLNRKPPAHHFTLSQLERRPGRVGRPTLLTPERRQVIEAAVVAEEQGAPFAAKRLAHEFQVHVNSVRRWARSIRRERRAGYEQPAASPIPEPTDADQGADPGPARHDQHDGRTGPPSARHRRAHGPGLSHGLEGGETHRCHLRARPTAEPATGLPGPQGDGETDGFRRTELRGHGCVAEMVRGIS